MDKETSRVEAFSDGVFAIAITLLILEIKVPDTTPTGLASQLWRQWPSYAAFLISFAFIGIMWINHHRLFSHIRHSDNGLLTLNLLLLLGVCVVPFPTAVVAKQWIGGDRRTAMLLYNATYFMIAILFNVLWRYCASRDGRLLGAGADRESVRKITLQYGIGPLAYLICLLAAFVSVNASLAMNAALAVYFAIPPSQSLKLLHRD
jgi:uncharacterized membrane protein